MGGPLGDCLLKVRAYLKPGLEPDLMIAGCPVDFCTLTAFGSVAKGGKMRDSSALTCAKSSRFPVLIGSWDMVIQYAIPAK
jgi:hypothetical protein